MNYLKSIFLLYMIFLQACILGSNNYSTPSPLKTYTVQFEGSKHGQSSHRTDITIFKNGNIIAANKPFPLPGSLPIRLTKYYPSITWYSDNILRLATFAKLENSLCDSMVIHNTTSEIVTYLRIESGSNEELVIIELQPKSSTECFLKSSTLLGSDRSWVGVVGYFSDGRITRGGQDFQNKKMSKIAAHYCVVIEESGVKITSLEFEGVTALSNRFPATEKDQKRVVIPKSISCDK